MDGSEMLSVCVKGNDQGEGDCAGDLREYLQPCGAQNSSADKPHGTKEGGRPEPGIDALSSRSKASVLFAAQDGTAKCG